MKINNIIKGEKEKLKIKKKMIKMITKKSKKKKIKIMKAK